MINNAKAVVIIHITDLHVRTSSSHAAIRLGKIAGAIGARIEEPTVLVLAITGDVAYSGLESEYCAANDAIGELINALKSWPLVDTVVVASAGNHDCDFKAMPEVVRDSLVGSLSKKDADVSPLLAALRPIQEKFFKFADKVSNRRLVQINELVSHFSVEIPGLNLKFLTVNTAVASNLREKPGTLLLPVVALPEIEAGADFCIVLAHHPLNWFDPQEAVLLSEWLDRTADMVLWGHEHRSDEFLQSRARSGSAVVHQVGLPLDDPESCIGLRVLRLDVATRELCKFSLVFNQEVVAVSEESVCKFNHNEGRDKGTVRFSDTFKIFLNDAGAAFTHPRVNRDVFLSDLFVAPEFREFKTEKADVERIEPTVTAEDLCKIVADSVKKVVIFGQEQSGKTTFVKYLLEWFRLRKIIPIYFDAQELRSSNRGEIRAWYSAAIRNQFHVDTSDKVAQTSPSALVAVVDNVHLIRGGQDGINLVLEFVGAKCGRTVCLTAENPALSILAISGSGEEKAYWKGGELFELMPMGHRRRGELIRRWVSMGRSVLDESGDIESEVRQIKVLIDKMLGKDSLPKYPIFVLIVIQQLEITKNNRTVIANGSHGYLFDALISQAIDKYVRSHEISTVTDFLAAISYEMWSRDVNGLTKAVVDEIIAEFLGRLVRVDGERLLEELDRGRILSHDGSLFRFRYNYVYFYYLARWICSSKNRGVSDVVLDRVVELVHTELAANVLIFVAHLEQEQRVIGRLVPFIRSLYPVGRDELKTLEAYSPLLLRFRTAQQRTILLDGSASLVSDETNLLADRANDQDLSSGKGAEIEDGLKLNATLKAVSALGQVLKSRASSVPPETKIEVSTSIIDVSRRLMRFLYELTENYAEDIVRIASDAFEKSFKLSKGESVDVANSLIGAIVVGTARTCISRAAEAIGSSELIPLLDKLGSEDVDDDSRLILLVARIGGERNYPKELVEDYVSSLKPGNILPRAVLAHAVARRFYLDPPSRGIRDSACTLLNINVKRISAPGMYGPRRLES